MAPLRDDALEADSAGASVRPPRSDETSSTGGTLLDELLEEQRHLETAVTRFSEWHDRHPGTPDQARNYRSLIPTTRPSEGEQFAFQVKLDECTGCKACVTACHSLNGLDDDESWRDVGALITTSGAPYQQTVTTACHHCEDPGCANGCPVLAYEKDEETGIVRHLDDQCIGCSYCILKCPYDVPKFNDRLGIVRKCDMCTARLADGEAPACVQACPNGAIGIEIVPLDRDVATADRLLPGVVTSQYTRPTTRYVTHKEIPGEAVANDARQLRIEHTHLPLVVMLVLTQFATGLFAAADLHGHPALLWAANGCLQLGLLASVLHLGQPLRAWRAFLGWRKSWLSREILVFGAFAPAGLAPLVPGLGAPVWPAWVLGAVGVFCSVMVYVDTQRPDWKLTRTGFRFFGTCLIALAVGLAQWDGRWAWVAAGLLLAKAVIPLAVLRLRPERYEARMHFEALPRLTLLRALTAVAAAFSLFVFPVAGVLLALGSELLERTLFFKTVRAWRMPGV